LTGEAPARSSVGQVDPAVVMRPPRLGRQQRRVGRALQARRRLRAGIVQLVYVAGGVALGVIIPRISVGSPVPTSKATEMLVAVGLPVVMEQERTLSGFREAA